MVLKANLKTAPKFENPEDEDGEVAVADKAPKAAAEEQPAPAKEAKTTAVAPAKPAAGAVVKKPAKINMADADVIGLLQDRLPPVDFGEGVRLVGSNGLIMDGDKKKLGSSIEFTLLSWNERYVVSPGDNGAEAKEHARYSLDGVTTTKGEDVKEYLETLKGELGYKKAAVKMYVDLFGILEGAEKATEHEGSTVVVSLSPDSVKSFTGFRRDLVVHTMLGRIEPIDVDLGVKLRIGTEVKSGNGNDWTRFTFSLAE